MTVVWVNRRHCENAVQRDTRYSEATTTKWLSKHSGPSNLLGFPYGGSVWDFGRWSNERYARPRRSV